MQTAKSQNIIISWLAWHFYEVPKFLFVAWNNYLSFGLYYFSIPLLMATFISPWRKYRWYYPKNINPGEYLAVFISNMFSRLMGMLSRTVLIVVGVIFEIGIIIAGCLVILIWFLLPLLAVGIIMLLPYV